MPQVIVGTAAGDSSATGFGGYDGLTTGAATADSSASGKSTIILTEVSQLAELSLVTPSNDIQAAQYVQLTLGAKPAGFSFASQAAQLALTQTAAKKIRTSEFAELTSIQGKVMDRVSQVAQLALVRANPERRKIRAFTFNMDGHSFYVLHLGELGTIVYDQLTKKWCDWQTQTHNNWRAGYGANWNADIVAGGIDNNIIYNIDPNSMFDDVTNPIISTITGGYPIRLRTSISCDEIMVTSSVGYAQAAGVTSTLRLRTSDNSGLSWQDWGTLDMSASTPQTEVSWRSLGSISAPGRIFELTDNGAALRINSIEMFSRDVNDG